MTHEEWMSRISISAGLVTYTWLIDQHTILKNRYLFNQLINCNYKKLVFALVIEGTFN